MSPANSSHPRRPQRPSAPNRGNGPIRQRAECWPPQPHSTGWDSEAAQRGPATPATPATEPSAPLAAREARPRVAPARVAPMPLLHEDDPATKPIADATPAHSRPTGNQPNSGWQAVPTIQTASRAPRRPAPNPAARTNSPTAQPDAATGGQGNPDQADLDHTSPDHTSPDLSDLTGDTAARPMPGQRHPAPGNPPPANPAPANTEPTNPAPTGPNRSGQPGKHQPGVPRYTIRDRQRPRIVSLDVARGVMLMVSVLSASLVTTPLPPAFTHAPWFGVHFLDLVFPVFVTMSGVGFAFAYARRVRPVVVLRRTVVLILLGLGYTALTTQTYNLANLRFTGVLQLYGVLAFCQGILHWQLRTWNAWFRWTTLLTILLTALHVAWPPAICALSGLTQTCNPSLYLDANLFGTAHIYQQGLAGHDPEGIIAMLGALLSMSAGTTLGHLLLQARRTGQRPLQAVSFLLMYCAALGAGLSFAVEPFKRLWTPSFALLACIPALAIVVLFWLILDRPDADATPSVPYYLRPLVSLGKNSLFVYFGSHLFMAMAVQTGTETTPAWPVTLAEHIGWAPWGLGILCVLTWTLLAMILDRFKIYIRA